MNLVFVYNADSGVFNTLTDIAHKLFSPETYQCNLCNLTHGYFQAHDEWTSFLDDLDAEIEFMHKDEFLQKYTAIEDNVDYPAIFVHDQAELKLWIDKEVINAMSSTDDLMETIRAALLRKQAGVNNGVDAFLRMPQ